MAAIMLSTGLVLEVAETRQQVLTALSAAGATATGQVNGVTTTVRATAVVAVADTIEGLRPKLVPWVNVDAPLEPA